MANVSPLRAEFAKSKLDKVHILRGNAEELAVFKLKNTAELCTVETGEVDQIHYQGEYMVVENGHSMMAKVIATGCALGALITALATKTTSPAVASIAALLWYGVAGELAAKVIEQVV